MKISRFGYFWLDTWILANVIQLATPKQYTHPGTEAPLRPMA